MYFSVEEMKHESKLGLVSGLITEFAGQSCRQIRERENAAILLVVTSGFTDLGRK